MLNGWIIIKLIKLIGNYFFLNIIICVYYIHMVHNIYKYNILIISYYIQIIDTFIKVIMHWNITDILKWKNEKMIFYVQNLLFEFLVGPHM
jgi:hypothetical protein